MGEDTVCLLCCFALRHKGTVLTSDGELSDRTKQRGASEEPSNAKQGCGLGATIFHVGEDGQHVRRANQLHDWCMSSARQGTYGLKAPRNLVTVVTLTACLTNHSKADSPLDEFPNPKPRKWTAADTLKRNLKLPCPRNSRNKHRTLHYNPLNLDRLTTTTLGRAPFTRKLSGLRSHPTTYRSFNSKIESSTTGLCIRLATVQAQSHMGS